jgi:hypothetical protein
MKTILLYATICIAFLFTACSSSSKETVTPDIKTNIVDKYWCPEIQGLTTYYFKSDGTYQQALAEDKTKPLAYGSWTLSGTTMKLVDKSGAGIDTEITFKNSTATTITIGTILGDFGYKVCP